mmetsp:Transcript_12688/g.19117  ORF Transcript_12688/g.19117 Transcript_12688/m.19117 type:complete len:103 (-) Transcript_12688:92-400(-)
MNKVHSLYPLLCKLGIDLGCYDVIDLCMQAHRYIVPIVARKPNDEEFIAICSLGLNNNSVFDSSCEISHETFVILIDGIGCTNCFVRLTILFATRPKVLLYI